MVTSGPGCRPSSPAAGPGRQQLARLRLGQDIHRDKARAVDRGQTGQLAAAGDKHQAAWAGREQRPHLRISTGVIQDDEHPPPGQDTAVQARLSFGARRDLSGRNPERGEEPADGLGRRGGRRGRIEPAQAHIQLAVREATR
jgi:hypothetical protein